MRRATLVALLALALAALVVSCAAWRDARHMGAVEAWQNALGACLASGGAYIGVTEEDNRALLAQCVDDYREAGRR